jgi:nucleoid DNA-binding protein
MNLENNLISKDKLQEVLINRLSSKLDIKPIEIDKVINFIFKDATKAFNSCTTVELSGFGVFRFSVRKLKIDIRKKEKKLLEIQKIENPSENILNFIKSLQMYIENAKTKINELEKN